MARGNDNYPSHGHPYLAPGSSKQKRRKSLGAYEEVVTRRTSVRRRLSPPPNVPDSDVDKYESRWDRWSRSPPSWVGINNEEGRAKPKARRKITNIGGAEKRTDESHRSRRRSRHSSQRRSRSSYSRSERSRYSGNNSETPPPSTLPGILVSQFSDLSRKETHPSGSRRASQIQYVGSESSDQEDRPRPYTPPRASSNSRPSSSLSNRSKNPMNVETIQGPADLDPLESNSSPSSMGAQNSMSPSPVDANLGSSRIRGFVDIPASWVSATHEGMRPPSGIASIAPANFLSQRRLSSGTLGDKSYRYASLNDSEIRLVNIHKATSSIITCEIHCVSLKSLPPYIAISYAWGDAEDTRQITLVEELDRSIDNGFEHERIQHDIPISSSLHGALEVIRERNRDVYVWADALCEFRRCCALYTSQ